MNDALDRKQSIARHAEQVVALAKEAVGCVYIKDGPANVAAAAIVASMIDGLEGLIALSRSQGQSHVQTLLRSMLESFADIRALAADPSYVDRMQLQAAIQHKKYALSRIEASESVPANQAGAESAKRDLPAVETHIAKLQAKGAKPLKVVQRFECGGIKGHYTWMYGELSSPAHGDLLSLLQRYVKDGRLVIGSPLSVNNCARYLGLACALINDSFNALQPFSSADLSKIRPILDRLVTHYEEITKMSDGQE